MPRTLSGAPGTPTSAPPKAGGLSEDVNYIHNNINTLEELTSQIENILGVSIPNEKLDPAPVPSHIIGNVNGALRRVQRLTERLGSVIEHL